jgi:hypothetical protein
MLLAALRLTLHRHYVCVACCAGRKRRKGRRPSKKKHKAGKDKDDDWDGELL